MKSSLLSTLLVVPVLVAIGQSVLAAESAGAGASPPPAITSRAKPRAIPTFHCLGIYWSPENGQAGRNVLIQFRQAGQQAWRDGLPMRYNPIKTPECKGDYRGSIVDLIPGAAYEVALTLEGTDIRTSFTAATWSENFPIAQTIKCKNSAETLKITKSGTPQGYVLYDGAGAVIDTANTADLGISVDANYVILRGFTIRNVKQHGIRIMNGHHIVIEDCDISKWGSEDTQGYGIDYQAGIYSNNKDLRALVIQRCRIHNPTWNTNSWAEDHTKGRDSRHPEGPQTIVFWDAEGNNVIRYNECWSDPNHYYNDVIGGGQNGSFRGFPGADSDIYGNYFANCWDDGIEVEGSGQNIRIWNNYIEETMMPIANAATSIGPLYIWRNVTGRSYTKPGSSWDLTHGYFMKMGTAGSERWMSGHIYVFNNTILQPNDQGANGLGGDSKRINHCVTRNNIFHVRSGDTHSISTARTSTDNDFDYDLLSAGRYPTDQEKHVIKGKPVYLPGCGFSFDSKTGSFQLAPGSPGFGKAVVIPNFCEPRNGQAPDVGAHQTGTPPMVFGIKAQFVPSIETAAR